MVDSYTGKPIKIFAGSDGYATILVRVTQLADVRRVLDDHAFRYEVSPRHTSIDNEPFTTLIDVHPPADAHRLQRLLDDA